MLGRLRSRLTYANVMSTLACVGVLAGGTAYAANTVFSADIVDGEVKVADIGQGAVATDEIANGQVKTADIGDGEVKTADLANGAASTDKIADAAVTTAKVKNDNLTGGDVAANSLKGADIDESSLAGLAFGNANTLDGKDSTDFAPADTEGWHVIGAPGEPAFPDHNDFSCEFSNLGAPWNDAAFYKDPWGVVHLRGVVQASNGNTFFCGSLDRDLELFQLPAGYRPAGDVLHATISGDEIGRVDIDTSGLVRVNGNNAGDIFTRATSYLSLEGIGFKAGG